MLSYMSLQVHYWVPQGNLYSPLGMAAGLKPATAEDCLQPFPVIQTGGISGKVLCQVSAWAALLAPRNHTSSCLWVPSKILVLGLVILALLIECLSDIHKVPSLISGTALN